MTTKSPRKNSNEKNFKSNYLLLNLHKTLNLKVTNTFLSKSIKRLQKMNTQKHMVPFYMSTSQSHQLSKENLFTTPINANPMLQYRKNCQKFSCCSPIQSSNDSKTSISVTYGNKIGNLDNHCKEHNKSFSSKIKKTNHKKSVQSVNNLPFKATTILNDKKRSKSKINSLSKSEKEMIGFSIKKTQLDNLTKNLKEKIKVNQKGNELMNKYNVIKDCFEEGIKLFSSKERDFLCSVLSSYDQIVMGFAKENEKLKEEIKKKENENKVYQKRSVKDNSGKSTEFRSKSSNSTLMVNSRDTVNKSIKDIRERVLEMNKNNIEDLDALYFLDKVKMREYKESKGLNIQSMKVIPILNLASKEESV